MLYENGQKLSASVGFAPPLPVKITEIRNRWSLLRALNTRLEELLKYRNTAEDLI